MSIPSIALPHDFVPSPRKNLSPIGTKVGSPTSIPTFPFFDFSINIAVVKNTQLVKSPKNKSAQKAETVFHANMDSHEHNKRLVANRQSHGRQM